MTIMLSLRFDRGLATDLAAPIKLPDGSMLYSGRAARTGDHEYPWGTERRDADELAAIVPQLPGMPVVVGHPNGLISAGAKAIEVGRVISARADGEHVAIEIRVDSDGVRAIDDGMREFSLGYTVESERGEPHRGTRVDHVALVRYSRCGESCALRADEAADEATKSGVLECHCSAERGSDQHKYSGVKMDELKQALAEAAAEKARADAAERERDAARADLARVEGERDAEKARADAAEQARADAADDFPTAVAARVRLEREAGKALGEDYRFDGKSDREIKIDVIKSVDKGFELPEGKGDAYLSAYVDGAYPRALERADEADKAVARVRESVTPSGERADADPHASYVSRMQNAWKQEAN